MGNCDSFQSAQAPILGRLGSVSQLRIINSVWLRDYQGLFDYQSKDIRQQLLKVHNNCFIFTEAHHKIAKQIKRSNVGEQVMKKAVFEVVKRSNFYKIQPIYIQSEQYTIQKLLWLVVRSTPNHRYPLKEKDVLKFGKQRIKVREIVLPEVNQSAIFETNAINAHKKIYDEIKQRQPEYPQLHPKDQPINEIASIVTESQQICRICLQPGEFTNPLICACKCTGSVRYIHLLCLRTWLGKQLDISKTKYCISIRWAPLHCQMCKTNYKYRIYLDNKKYYTVEIPKPAKPYVVLQIVKKNTDLCKIFHFVSMAQNSKLSIGRKKEIDIKLSQDISVSRHHANLIYDFEERQFLIEDNKSKFGTLVLIKRNLLVSPLIRGLSFQIAGELFTFETSRNQGVIPDYYDQVQYLNVVEKGSGQRQQEEQSDENNEEQDDFVGEIQNHLNDSQDHTHPRIPPNPHHEDNIPPPHQQIVNEPINPIPPQQHSIQQNQSSHSIHPIQPLEPLQPIQVLQIGNQPVSNIPHPQQVIPFQTNVQILDG